MVFFTVTVALHTGLAVQGGVEFGWTQLPDDRVEYIIQLDEQSLEALKAGQSLTSSLPPEVQTADRIRLQYGSGVLPKPILSRKPQSINPSPVNPQAGHAGRGPGSAFADTPPTLSVEEFGALRSAPPELDSELSGSRGLNGQTTVRQGNQKLVTNSSLFATRPTAFVTQDGGADANHWSSSNRVIGNYDNQDRVAAESRTGGVYPPVSPTGDPSLSDNRGGGLPREVNPGFTSGDRNPINPAGSSLDPNRASGSFGNGYPGDSGQAGSNFSNRMAPVSGTNQNPGQGGTNGWTSVTNPNRPLAGYGDAASGTGGGAVNPGSGYNPGSVYNPNLAAGSNQNLLPQNNYPQVGYAANNFPNAHAYLPQPHPGTSQPAQSLPVSTPAASNEVAMLNKTIEEMKNEQRQRDHEQEIAKLKAEQKAELEKLTAQFKEFQQKKQEPSESATAKAAVAPAATDDSRGRGSSGIASVFLVISLGLNVFLVVQYLSVQNQFRDLSNDLRDTFMTNNYE